MKKTLFIFILGLLFCTQANAQPDPNYTLGFVSQPGVRLAQIFTDGFESGGISRLDCNGDNKPELVMKSEDTAGNLLGILVVDLARKDTIWRVQDVHQTLGMSDIYPVSFFGCADVDADGKREVIFGNDQDVRIFDHSDNSEEWALRKPAGTFIPSDFPVLLRAVTDVTGDGFENLIIVITETKQVQVWGHP